MLDMSLSEHNLTLLREITTNSGLYSTGGSKPPNTFKRLREATFIIIQCYAKILPQIRNE